MRPAGNSIFKSKIRQLLQRRLRRQICDSYNRKVVKEYCREASMPMVAESSEASSTEKETVIFFH